MKTLFFLINLRFDLCKLLCPFFIILIGLDPIDVKSQTVVTLTVNAAAVNASINATGEEDWYKFQSSTAGNYTIRTYGSLDTYMYLFQSDQSTLITENDDGVGVGYNSVITRSLTANTWYYIKIKGYNGTRIGDYSVDVKKQTETIITLIVDAPAVNAAISATGEEDWYKFQTSTAGNYTIRTYGSLDTYMYLFQTDQSTLITENDDGVGVGYNSVITRNLTANTWYYVKIKGYNGIRIGDYSVDVKKQTETIITLIVDAAALNAAISLTGEEDWYKFQTSTAGNYTIRTYGSLDTYMYLFQSDQSTLITENDDGVGVGYNSVITRNLTANTWYYVKIKGYNGTRIGDYSVDVKKQTETIITLIVDASALNAAISLTGEEDWYKFQTSTAGNYTIRTYGSLDTYMYLFQSDQSTLITENDDGVGVGYNSVITQNLAANTWYYVKIKGYNGTRIGDYSVDVKKQTESIGTLIVDAPAVSAAISTAGEEDWFKFLIITAGTYTIQTYGNLDTYMYLYQGDQSTLIIYDDDAGVGQGSNAGITLNLNANTWYYAKVKEYNSTITGNYTIDIKSQPVVTLTLDTPPHEDAISIIGEEDWFKFQTNTAGNYTIQTYGNLNTYMYLYQNDLITVISVDNDGSDIGYNSKITQNLNANTWYFIRLRENSGTSTGSYSIDVQSPTSTVTLTVDAPAINASIIAVGEEDWFKFKTGIAGSYLIQTYGNLDTYMFLYENDRITVIAENDDVNRPGGNYNSMIRSNLSASTWYYVKIKSYDGIRTGEYSIDVKKETETVATLAVDAPPTEASISIPGEQDWYKFQTSTAGLYIIETYGTLDTYMYLYGNDQTTLIAENDDIAHTPDSRLHNSRISINLNANTWYYIKIREYHSTVTGNYSLDNIYEYIGQPPKKLKGYSRDGAIILNWSVPLLVSPTSYNVYWSESENGTYTLMSNVLINSVTYNGNLGLRWYYVTAIYPGIGESGPSNKVSVSPFFASQIVVDAPPINDAISTPGENDWYKFQTGTAGIYTIVTYGDLDTYMELYQSDQTMLAFDDDDGPGLEKNAGISISLRANTWYYVKVREYSTTAVGSYSIDVKGPLASFVTLTVDSPPINVAISAALENDWYRFKTITAGTYTIHTYGELDTYMYLYQSDLNTLTLIAENDDAPGSGRSSGITMNLSPNIWYYVLIIGYHNYATGNYSIDVKTQPVELLTVNATPADAIISTPGENNWFKFLTNSTGYYTIQTYGNLDTYMYLYQSDMISLVSKNDDGIGTGYNASIIQYLNAETWYYVRIIEHNPAITGVYSIDVKNDASKSIGIGTNIKEDALIVPSSSDILIYPNPASDYINLVLPGDFNNLIRLEIMDLSGKQIANQNLKKDQQINKTISVQDLPSGLYFVKIVFSDRIVLEKFIKE